MAESLFDNLADRYDAWFDSPDGAPIFAAEARCVRALLEGAPRPWLEVGVGTGRFAETLGIEEGLDPSRAVLKIAAGRGVRTCFGHAEQMPYEAQSFGTVLMVVTICFVDDAQVALDECVRVLADGGSLIVGLVPADSAWGKRYARQGEEGHVFYSEATFYTCEQVVDMSRQAGLDLDAAMSCIFTQPEAPLDSDEPMREGVIESAGFVAMRFTAQR